MEEETQLLDDGAYATAPAQKHFTTTLRRSLRQRTDGVDSRRDLAATANLALFPGDSISDDEANAMQSAAGSMHIALLGAENTRKTTTLATPVETTCRTHVSQTPVESSGSATSAATVTPAPALSKRNDESLLSSWVGCSPITAQTGEQEQLQATEEAADNSEVAHRDAACAKTRRADRSLPSTERSAAGCIGTLLVQDLSPKGCQDDTDSEGAELPQRVLGVATSTDTDSDARDEEELPATIDDGMQRALHAAQQGATRDAEESLLSDEGSSSTTTHNSHPSAARDVVEGERYSCNDDTPLIPPQVVQGAAAATSRDADVMMPPVKRSSREGTADNGPTATCPAEPSVGLVVGMEVDAKWGAQFYPATVVTLIGKAAVEVQWKKDNSRMTVRLKDVRCSNRSRPISATPGGASRTSPGKSKTSVANKGSVTPIVFTSTQMVRMMDEEDEIEGRQRSVREACTIDARDRLATTQLDGGAATNASPEPRRQSVFLHGCATTSRERQQREANDAIRTDLDPVASLFSAPLPSAPLSGGSTTTGGTSQFVRRAASADYGDCATPPCMLVYVSQCARKDLGDRAGELLARLAALMPSMMVASTLRDVVMWAAHAAYQQCVPFVMLLSPRALALSSESSGTFDDRSALSAERPQPVRREVVCADVALALGVTPLSVDWISDILDATLEANDARNAALYESHRLPIELLDSGSSSRAAPLAPPAGACSVKAVRLFPLPKHLRACAGDVLWCPQSGDDADLLMSAAGADIVTSVEEVQNITRGTGRGQDGSPVRVFVYAPPGCRVGRSAEHSSITQLELQWLQRTVRHHFNSNVATRPVSNATTSATAPTPQPKASRNVPFDEVGGSHATRKRNRESDEMQQANSIAASLVAHAISAVQTSHAIPIEDRMLSQHSRPPSETRGSCRAVMLPPVRRRPDLRIVINRDDQDSRSGALPPLPPPLHNAAVPLAAANEELTNVSAPTSAAFHHQVMIGDDFYFAMPSAGEENVVGDAVVMMGIGRIAALHSNECVTLRLYQITTVIMQRQQRVSGRCAAAGSQPIRRLTTLVLTTETVTVHVSALDFDTPLFVVDEHQLEHLYILQKPSLSNVGLPHADDRHRDSARNADDQGYEAIQAAVAIVNQFPVEIVRGMQIAFRLPPALRQRVAATHSTDVGHDTCVGVVQDVRRDVATSGVIVLVGHKPLGEKDAASYASTTPITPDMIVDVLR